MGIKDRAEVVSFVAVGVVFVSFIWLFFAFFAGALCFIAFSAIRHGGLLMAPFAVLLVAASVGLLAHGVALSADCCGHAFKEVDMPGWMRRLSGGTIGRYEADRDEEREAKERAKKAEEQARRSRKDAKKLIEGILRDGDAH